MRKMKNEKHDLPGLSNVIGLVERIALPDSDEDLRAAHASWFLCLAKTMKDGGYDLVTIKFPGVSKEFATGIASASYQQILTLCNGEISLLKPAFGDKEILNTLNNICDSNMLLLLSMLNSQEKLSDLDK